MAWRWMSCGRLIRCAAKPHLSAGSSRRIALPARVQHLRMNSYAVVWCEPDASAVHAGSAELDDHGVALRGGWREAPCRHYIPDDELAEVSCDSTTKIGPSKALRLVTRDGLSFLIAAPFGIGVFVELFEQLAARVV